MTIVDRWNKETPTFVFDVNKHLAGKHDQSTHAGGRGGSAASQSKPKYNLSNYQRMVDDPAFLKEAKKVLRSQGQMYISDADFEMAYKRLQFRSLAFTDDQFEPLFKDADEALQELIAQPNSISVFVPEETFMSVLDDGRLATLFDAADIKGEQYYALRSFYEKAAFGYDETNTRPSERPVSGAVMPMGKKYADEFGENYGNVRIILKDDVKARTTFTLGDSLDTSQRPTLMGGNLPRTVDILNTANGISRYKKQTGGNVLLEPRWHGGNYVEAQVHGGVKLADIERVIIRYPEYGVDTDALDRLGIPYEIDEGNN